jgi:uncharacterized coiled-coil protein SlyX
MSVTLSQLEAKVDELTVAITDEKQQVADLLAAKDASIAQKDVAIAALNETVAELQVLVAEGGTTEQRQALLDKLTANVEQVNAIV